MITGQTIIDFIKKYNLEEVDDIVFDQDTINFNITLDDGKWISYSLFNFGVHEDIVLWPSCNEGDFQKGPVDISKEDAKRYREAGKADDYSDDAY